MTDYTSQVSASTPFDGTERVDGTPVVPPMVSENARDGIIEARDYAEGTAAGYIITCAKSSNASNTYLEFFDSISSDQNPFVFIETNRITGFSVSTKTASTCEYDILINGVSIYTVFQIGTKSVYAPIPAIEVQAGDELSIFVQNGTANRPILNTFAKVGGIPV